MQKAGYKDSPGLWFTKEVKKREKRKEGEGRRERERRKELKMFRAKTCKNIPNKLHWRVTRVACLTGINRNDNDFHFLAKKRGYRMAVFNIVIKI